MKYLKKYEHNDIINNWSNYYGNQDTAEYKYETFMNEFNMKNLKGGSIFRCIFVDSIEEINKEKIGTHWTLESYYIEDYIDSIKQYYGRDKKLTIIIEAYTPPNNIKVCDDLGHHPDEKEINILDFTKINIINYYYYERGNFKEIKF